MEPRLSTQAATGGAPEERSSYREVFAIGEFHALWSAQVLYYTGDQFAEVAIAMLVYGRAHSAFRTALAYARTGAEAGA